MEKSYLVSYDLDKPGQNYERLIARLKQFRAIRVLYSQWVLRSTLTAIELRDDLKTYVDANDRLLITRLTNDWASYNLMGIDEFKKIAAA